MSFLRWIENMRAKPVKSRRLAAFAISLSLTAFLFVIWVSVLLPGFFGAQTVAQISDQKNQSFETPKETLFQNIQTAWNTLGSQIGQLKSTVGSTLGSTINTVNTVNLSAAVQYTASTTSTTTTAKTTVHVTDISSPSRSRVIIVSTTTTSTK